MNDNEEILIEVTKLIQSFESEKDAEFLRKAYQKLEQIKVYRITNSANRERVRAVTSGLWLKIINLIDENLSENFDPENTIQIQAVIPPGKNGAIYPLGINPDSIIDTEDRAAYKKAIADHSESQEKYRLEMHLYRLNEQVSDAARDYFILAYQRNEEEQNQLKLFFEEGIKRQSRIIEFMKFVQSF